MGRALDAVLAGDLDELRRVLADDPAQADEVGGDGVSVLRHALYRRQDAAAEAIAAAGATLSIHDAAAIGDADRIVSLLRGDPDLKDSVATDGFVPLHLASFFGRIEAARLLLDSGAAVDRVAANPSRVQPLHSAVAAAHLDVAALLVERGAPVNAAQAGGWTPLQSAAHQGNAELVELLLAAGADPHQAAEDGRTAVSMAEADGHHEVAGRLRSSG
jgi:ankyrin repeat protein